LEEYTKNFICGFRNRDLLNAKQESSTLCVDTVKALRINLRHEVCGQDMGLEGSKKIS
jgi:hypothetical protein